MVKFEELNVQYSMINIKFSMKKIVIAFSFSLLTFNIFGQAITQKLQKAFTAFEKDSQLKHAISSLYVIDANTGQVVFDKNSQIGLAPASTQKIITSVTAFELLGKDYRYKTEFGFKSDTTWANEIFIKGYGDPTFGSNRFVNTKPENLLNVLYNKLTEAGYKGNFGLLVVDDQSFETINIPNGWIWEDIGNYYGAGAGEFNWRENQYDITLRSTPNIGDKVEIVAFNGRKDYKGSFISEARSAAKGTGDNAYIYFPIGNTDYTVRGTIPVNENNFTISGAVSEGSSYFAYDLGRFINDKNKSSFGEPTIGYSYRPLPSSAKIVYAYFSPSLDSIIYWFNKKSINLYGEALIKTFAYEKKGFGSTDSGVVVVKKFWKEKGIDEDELNIVDGSGLSPLNRVTTHSQVEILKFAKTKDWFPSFKNSLPEYNGMSMKSGTIRGVKGFCGYHKAKNGKEYIFSFLVNNYNGSASALVNKMYKVVDVLK